MNPTPIISICIPTFQRKEALKRTLDRIIQIERLVPNKIEICISDNASTDGTFEMIKNYSKTHHFIRFRKNRANLGFDLNLVASFKMARGKYCWGIGDDDTPISKGLVNLIKLLDNQETFSLGLTGAVAYKRDIRLKDKYFKLQKYSKKDFVSRLKVILKNSTRLSESYHDITILGFLPCYLFNARFLKNSLRFLTGEKYGWYHLALLFYALSHFKGNIIANGDISLIHGQNIEHKKDSFLLPGGDFDLFVTKRRASISEISNIDNLKKYFYSWLNIRGNYFYLKSLVEMTPFSERISLEKYLFLKKQVCSIRNQIKLTPFMFITTSCFMFMERFDLFRRIVSRVYYKVHPSYVHQIDNYLKGRLQTNDEREGRDIAREIKK